MTIDRIYQLSKMPKSFSKVKLNLHVTKENAKYNTHTKIYLKVGEFFD